MKTIILCDCHIGSNESNYRLVEKFIFKLECDRLILNGDFWDLWDMSVNDVRDRHDSAVRIIRQAVERKIEIVHILGNHDEECRKNPVVSGLNVVDEFVWLTPSNRRIVVTHGHQFDYIMKKYTTWYRLSCWLNRLLYYVGLNAKRFKTCIDFRDDPKFSKIVENIHAAAMDKYRAPFTTLVIGHTHSPTKTEQPMPDGGFFTFINGGDWKVNNTYVEIVDDVVRLRRFEE